MVWRSLSPRQGGIGKSFFVIVAASCLSLSSCNERRFVTLPAGMSLATPPARMIPAVPVDQSAAAESYERIQENKFLTVTEEPLSTFSIDVDTASYSNVRRFLNDGQLPPPDAVRIEELINYFAYDYPQPQPPQPICMNTEVCECPWNKEHQLVRIGLKGKTITRAEMPRRNFVFLIDVSGSMDGENRLSLVKKSLEMLVEQLTDKDRVAIVTYAGDAGLRLASTPGNEYRKITKVIHGLTAGGSTNGGEGIHLAYKIARENFMPGGLNRVILATDGDFNVGVTSRDELVKLVEEQRKNNICLTVLGYGMGNLRDDNLEKLADCGDGHYAYIDLVKEARRVFVEQGAALITIARDVKIQVEFNPKQVSTYRLLGYENRLLKAEDFNNDEKDAGDMGAGHTVTALYEVVPAGRTFTAAKIDALKYQQPPVVLTAAADSGELLTLKLRYKEPESEQSKLLNVPVQHSTRPFTEASADMRFAAAVAGFGMLLRNSQHRGELSYHDVRHMAEEGRGRDVNGHRAEFLRLVEIAQSLAIGRVTLAAPVEGLR